LTVENGEWGMVEWRMGNGAKNKEPGSKTVFASFDV